MKESSIHTPTDGGKISGSVRWGLDHLDHATSGTFWSMSLFLGWFLSFPLNGPLLGALAALRGSDAAVLGLVFTLFHGAGLAVAGLWLAPERWRAASAWSLLACFLLSAAAYWSGPDLQPFWVGGLGLASALFFIGWSYPFVHAVTGNRIRFMAALTLTANLILYVVNGVMTVLPHGAVFLVVTLLLPASGLFLKGQFPSRAPSQLPVRVGFPLGLMWVLGLVIFGLYINGGLLYTIIYPAFATHRSLNLYFENTPYLATLVLIALFGDRQRRRLAPYLGVTLLGMGFVLFGLLETSLLSYFLTSSLLLAAFAVLDVFVWTLLADIGELHGHSFQVFGFGLATNILAIFAGGLLGNWLGSLGPEYPLLTGLLASGTVFATVMLLPVMHSRAAKNLAERAQVAGVLPNKKPLAAEIEVRFPGAQPLTGREIEIVTLIIGGDSNSDIAKRLFISENTVKVHVKNINRKLGVANRYELLVALMRRQEEFAEPV